MRKSCLLQQNWQFRFIAAKNKTAQPGLKKKGWQPATVPGTVHTDLLTGKQIPDPFYADTEVTLDWICKNNWQYRNQFNLPPDFEVSKPLYIIFDGIDTFAEISLNGHVLGNAENMFRTYRWEISRYVSRKKNILLVTFTNPFEIYQNIRRNKGADSDPSWEPRVYLRKAQYSFGWDWGPALPTMGIWRQVRLEQDDRIRIKALRFTTREIKNKRARIKITVDCEGRGEQISAVRVRLAGQRSHYETFQTPSSTSKGQLQYIFDWEIADPLLWWPNGMGKANLYDLEATVLDQPRFDYTRFSYSYG